MGNFRDAVVVDLPALGQLATWRAGRDPHWPLLQLLHGSTSRERQAWYGQRNSTGCNPCNDQRADQHAVQQQRALVQYHHHRQDGCLADNADAVVDAVPAGGALDGHLAVSGKLRECHQSPL